MSGLSITLSLLAFALLTLGTAIFVAAEFSLTALERSTVDANARSGGAQDKMVQRAHHTLSFQLSGAQIGISITTLITGYLAEPVFARLIAPALSAMAVPERWIEPTALILALLIATSFSMVFGELVAQYLAVAEPLKTARMVSGPVVLFSALFTPLIKVTNGTANKVLRRLGMEPADELGSARSPQELVSLVRNSAAQGSLDPSTAKLVDRSLQFGGRSAEEFMTPRSKVVSLEADDTVADLLEAVRQTGHSRFPVTRGDLDETIGVVHLKQVLEIPHTKRSATRLSGLARPVPVVPSTLDGDALMAQIRGTALHTALVADEYGGIAGIITGEDLVEEIVGDIRDEHDSSTPEFEEISGGHRVSGLLRIDEVAEETGFRAPDGDYETIGGVVMAALGHIPAAGDSVELRGFDADAAPDRPPRWRATVVRMDGRRVDQVDLVRLDESEGDGVTEGGGFTEGGETP